MSRADVSVMRLWTLGMLSVVLLLQLAVTRIDGAADIGDCKIVLCI